MELLFKTLDEKQWNLNTTALQWFCEAEDGSAETGDLIPQGFGMYGLNPRTPQDGLSVIQVIPDFQESEGVLAVVINLRSNTDVKDFMLKEGPKAVLYNVLPALRSGPAPSRPVPVPGKPGMFKQTVNVSVPKVAE